MTNQECVDGMRLMIATPFYEGHAHVGYLKAFADVAVALTKAGVQWTTYFPSGDAYVDRAKNAICAYFLESDCTHLFMVDSDLQWDLEGFMRVLLAPYDMVGGVYPMKRQGCEGIFPVSIYTNDDLTPKCTPEGLIEAMMIPGGFMRIRREPLRQLSFTCDHYMCTTASYKGNTANMFDTILVEHTFVGEDVVFCKKWRDKGYKIYVEPRVTFAHTGPHNWIGNYHNFLVEQPKPSPDGELPKEYRNATGWADPKTQDNLEEWLLKVSKEPQEFDLMELPA